MSRPGVCTYLSRWCCSGARTTEDASKRRASSRRWGWWRHNNRRCSSRRASGSRGSGPCPQGVCQVLGGLELGAGGEGACLARLRQRPPACTRSRQMQVSAGSRALGRDACSATSQSAVPHMQVLAWFRATRVDCSAGHLTAVQLNSRRSGVSSSAHGSNPAAGAAFTCHSPPQTTACTPHPL